MNDNLVTAALLGFVATLGFLVVLAKGASSLGLLDSPNERKQHIGAVPLVGGLAIFLTLLLKSTLWLSTHQAVDYPQFVTPAIIFVVCITLLTVSGVLDDRFNLPVLPRVLSEIFVAGVSTAALGLNITSLGNLLGTGNVQLPPGVAFPFTVIAFFGVINAFNMLDGIDGQVAAVTLLSLVGMTVITGVAPSHLTMVVLGATLAFLLSNLGVSQHIPRTFLGDAGSKLLGFIVVLSLVSLSAGRQAPSALEPVSALFIIALPLYDMVYVSVRRTARGRSPFSADRGHLHHLLQQVGLSPRRALLAALILHSFIILLGYALNAAQVATATQFGVFLAGFGLYCLMCQQNWWHIGRRQQGYAQSRYGTRR